MFLPTPVYIGLRYLKFKKRHGFLSFINWVSILSIALSVMVLVTVLSVMNGFDDAVSNKIFDVAHHIVIEGKERGDLNQSWPKLREIVLQHPQVVEAAPFLVSQGLLISLVDAKPILVYGILPFFERSVSTLPKKLIQGQFALSANQASIILGEQIAWDLNVGAGSRVTLLISNFPQTTLDIKPKMQEFTVGGIFRTGKGFGLDNSLAYVHLEDLQKLYPSGDQVTGLRLKTPHLYQAPQVANDLKKTLPKHYQIRDWTESYGSLVTAIALEKTMTFSILILLIAIAAFNLVSALMMLVFEKQSDIAILRTLGMSQHSILLIFIVQGSLIGIMSTVIGLIGGVSLTQNLSYLIKYAEYLFNSQLFASNIFIEELPTRIDLFDFMKVGIISIVMSILATLYPAWKASCTMPAKALHYE